MAPKLLERPKFAAMFERGRSLMSSGSRGGGAGGGSEEVEVMQGLVQSGRDLDVLLPGLTESLWKKEGG